MSKRRAERAARNSGGTLSLAEAAAQLGVPVEDLLEALEESGIRPTGAGTELRLEAAEVERYRRVVAQGRASAQQQLAALLDDLE